jgi:glycosyltransferase involved in cell wall biosynthesis
MADELARVSVFACLSEFESQGIAVLEALGQGCRAVVARAPGLTALIEAGLARGVDLDSSPEVVGAAIIAELERPPRANPPKLPTWDECADALHRLYLTVPRPMVP